MSSKGKYPPKIPTLLATVLLLSSCLLCAYKLLPTLVYKEPLNDKVFAMMLSKSIDRADFARKNMAKLGFSSIQLITPSGANETLESRLNTQFSSIYQAFDKFASTRNFGWVVFFEDDVEVHPNISYSEFWKCWEKATQLVSTSNIILLGVCGPQFIEELDNTDSRCVLSKVYGFCAHAFAVHSSNIHNLLHNVSQYKNGKAEAFDVFLLKYEQNFGALLLGSTLRSPVVDDHYGIVFQDRNSFATSMFI